MTDHMPLSRLALAFCYHTLLLFLPNSCCPSRWLVSALVGVQDCRGDASTIYHLPQDNSSIAREMAKYGAKFARIPRERYFILQ